MKYLFFIFFFLLSFLVKGQKLNASFEYEINSRGISVIPAFNIDDPAHLLYPVINFGKFSYKPIVAYKLNFQQWFNMQRIVFNQTLSKDSLFSMSIGPALGNQANNALIFTDNGLDPLGREVVRYLNLTSDFKYKISQSSSVILTYWYAKGLDERTVNGHYVQVTYSRLFKSKSFDFTLIPAIFAITFDGQNDGLFFSNNILLNHKKAKWISLKSQLVLPIESNSGSFAWNLGIVLRK
jgi:hypothetical protein